MPNANPHSRAARSVSTEQVIVSEHLAELRGRVRMLTWISGLGWTAIALLGGLIVAGTLDWLIHFDESGTRFLVAAALAGGSGWLIWRRLIAPLRQQLTGTFLASRIERRFPGSNSRIVSAVEFLEHRVDSRLGSTELQKVVIAKAIKDLEKVDASDVVESKSIRKVTIAGALVTAAAFLIVLLHPLEAATSLQRWVFPFSSVPWPRAVELQLVKPDLSPFERTTERPYQIARGDTLELYVLNQRGRLPDRVWFEYRQGDDGQLVRESLRLTTIRDQNDKQLDAAVIGWIASRGTMQFRVTAGDDDQMSFQQIEVVQPPIVESLQVTIEPPKYSGQPIEERPAGVGHIQGLVGSKISVAVGADKTLGSAILRIGDKPAIPLNVDADGRHFSAQFTIDEAVSSNYWFELTDTQGFKDREAVRYELKGIADGVPEVSIEIPSNDVMLTADAELPVKVLAKDDLALNEVRIEYFVGDAEASVRIPLLSRSQKPSEATQNAVGESDAKSEAMLTDAQRYEADYLWKLADLKLAPGTRIVFHGEATDFYDLGVPHLGRSLPRTITIVSAEEKKREVAARVGDLLDDLRQAAQLQQRAKQQTEELKTQLENVGELRSQDVDQLRRTELDQKQAASRLTNPSDGVEKQARQLLDELRGNQVSDGETEERLERLSNELGRLEREEFPAVERALTRAEKLAEGEAQKEISKQGDKQNSTSEELTTQSNEKSISENRSADQTGTNKPQSDPNKPTNNAEPSTPSKDEQEGSNAAAKDDSSQQSGDSKPNASDQSIVQPADKNGQPQDDTQKKATSEAEKALAEAQQRQARTLETLEELQESLSEWRDKRDVARDLNSVIDEQEAVQKESAEMAQRTMTKSAAELSKQDKAELNKLAARQSKVAEQLEQFRKQLERTAKSVEQNDPEVSEQLNEVGQQLKNLETNGKLQDAAQNIAENRMGAATEAQQKAMEELHEVERMMKRQPNEDTEQFLKQTQESLEEVQQIRQEQQNLADRFEELSRQPDSPEKDEQMKAMMEQQEELAERMGRAERKLERLRLHGPAEAANQARKRVTEMMQQMQETDDDVDMQQAMDEALDDLEQVERELVLEKRIARERLAFEQLEKMEDELKSLRSRQETVIAETVRLDQAKGDRETLTRGQKKTLIELRETERSLQHAVEQIQQQMASAEVFALYLKRLARSLKLASDGLDAEQMGEHTQSLENDALKKIESVLAVLKQEKKKPDPAKIAEEQKEELGQEPQTPDDKPEEAQPPGDSIPQLAQLKLLKAMQEEYLERTESLEKFRDKEGKLPEAMETELTELAREQVELADFARNLMSKLLPARPEPQDHEEKSLDKVEEKKSEPKEEEAPKDQKKEKEKAPDPNKIDL